MANIRYRLWAEQQDKEFIKYIHGDKIPDSFKDENKFMELALEELAILDDKFINNPEGK